MFGIDPYPRLKKSLLESGVTATATVLDAHQKPPSASSMRGGTTYRFDTITWNVALRVNPESEAEFEVRQEMRVPSLIDLSPGFTLQVLYDPSDRTRMIIDPRTIPDTKEAASAWYALSDLKAKGVDTTGLEELPDAATVMAAARQRLIDANYQAMAQRQKARAAGLLSPGVGVDAASVAIEQLNRLKELGVIDAATCEAKKQQLLDRL